MKIRMFAGVATIMILLSGCSLFVSQPSDNVRDDAMMEDSTVKDDAMMEKTVDDAMMDDTGDDEMMDDDSMADDVMTDDTATYSGTVLAGTIAPVIDFNQADYEKALQTDKLVVLYFYANWCPTCKAEIPKFYEAFNQLTTDNVIAFRVNYNDNETDSFEQALARQHGVAYQHTKVFVKNGQRILKAPNSWDTAEYLSQIKAEL